MVLCCLRTDVWMVILSIGNTSTNCKRKMGRWWRIVQWLPLWELLLTSFLIFPSWKWANTDWPSFRRSSPVLLSSCFSYECSLQFLYCLWRYWNNVGDSMLFQRELANNLKSISASVTFYTGWHPRFFSNGSHGPSFQKWHLSFLMKPPEFGGSVY